MYVMFYIIWKNSTMQIYLHHDSILHLIRAFPHIVTMDNSILKQELEKRKG